MMRGVYKALSIEYEERISVLLLLSQSVFLGIFYGAFDIGATALFLDVFEAERLPGAFIISGLAGIILTSIYSKLQTRISFKNLAVINLITVAAITCLLRFGFEVYTSDWLIFFVFVMMGPLNIIALLGFWGTVGRMFTLRQGKRLFGLIDTGQIMGIILSSYTVPLIIMTFDFETKNLLLISSVSIFIALIFQSIIGRKYKFREDKVSRREAISWRTRIKEFFHNRYIAMMAVFIFLSVVTAFFIAYSFLAVSNDQYPQAKEFAQFLGFFTGTLMIFTVIIKTFVYSRLMKTYGLKVSLVISAILVGFFSITAALVGAVFGFTTAAGASFMLFFLLISLSRLFSRTLKDAIEAPSFKILYQSLDVKIRYDVQANIDGTINEVAALSSGLILALLGSLSFFQLIHFSYVLIFIIVAWVFVSLILYREYRGSLQSALAGFRQSGIGDTLKKFDLVSLVNNSFNLASEFKAIRVLKFARLIKPGLYKSLLLSGLKHKSPEVRKHALDQITGKSVDLTTEIREMTASQKHHFNKKEIDQINNYLKQLSKSEHYDKIDKLLKSKSTEERLEGIRLLNRIKKEPETSVILSLLRDLDPQVKKEAISLVSNFNQSALASSIVEFLSTDQYYSDAFHSLVNLGEGSLESLEQYFYKSGIETITLIRILKIFGLVGTDKAIQYLLPKLNYHNHEVVLETVKSLRSCDFQVREDDLVRLQQVIENIIEITAWNIAASLSVNEEEVGTYLVDALEEEISSNYDLLFDLLSLAYEPQSIYHIRNNLESGTAEGVNFALELLDLVITEELKPKLFPLLDDISREDKIKQLQDFYPVHKMDSPDLLLSLLNRDYNKINVWTKACAILGFSFFKKLEITDDLIAQLFNPDPLLREISARIIHETDAEKYNECEPRLPEQYKIELSRIINLKEVQIYQLLAEKIFYLKKTKEFTKRSCNQIYKLARNLECNSYSKNYDFVENTSECCDSFYWIIDGKVQMSKTKSEQVEIGKYSMFCNFSVDGLRNNSFILKALEDTLCYKIDRKKLDQLMFDFPDITEVFIKWTGE
jgi:AAA family ATP:ADP antiporter